MLPRLLPILPIITLLLFLASATLTHIPGDATPPLPGYSDKLYHALGYFLLSASLLITLASRAHPHPRRTTAAIIIPFAVLDEATQPLFQRHFELLDIAADITGLLLALALLSPLARRLSSEQSA